MPKDYKDAPSPRAESSRLAHPLLLGMIIGLLLGIVISLAVALWLNRLSNPFVEKGRAPEPISKVAPAQPQAPAEAAKAAERPRFEFYRILPGEKEVTEKEASAAVTPKPPPPLAKAGSSPAAPKPHSGEIYWLQAGAFTDQSDADNLKAKIALTGLEASVRPVSIPDKGTLYRVRLGPYESLDAANRIKVALTQNGVGAAIIRTTDEAPKKQ